MVSWKQSRSKLLQLLVLSQYINWFSQNHWYNHDGNPFGEVLIIEVFFVTLVTTDHWSLCCSVLGIPMSVQHRLAGQKGHKTPDLSVHHFLCTARGWRNKQNQWWRPLKEIPGVQSNDDQRGIQSTTSKDITAVSSEPSRIQCFPNIITSKHGNIHLQKHCRYVVQKHHRSYIQFYQRQKHLILYHTVVILVS